MARTEIKKVFMISDSETKELLDKGLADLAKVTRTSTSAQVERILLETILPKNPDANSWIRKMYLDDVKIGQILSIIYGHMGVGINCEPSYNNAIELVQFSRRLSCFAGGDLDETDLTWFHFMSQLKSVVEGLAEHAADTGSEQIITYKERKAAEYAKELLEMLTENPGSVRLHSLWDVIIDNWTVICNWQPTYRLMADLSSMQVGLQNTAENRIELISILKKVSDEWM